MDGNRHPPKKLVELLKRRRNVVVTIEQCLNTKALSVRYHYLFFKKTYLSVLLNVIRLVVYTLNTTAVEACLMRFWVLIQQGADFSCFWPGFEVHDI